MSCGVMCFIWYHVGSVMSHGVMWCHVGVIWCNVGLCGHVGLWCHVGVMKYHVNSCGTTWGSSAMRCHVDFMVTCGMVCHMASCCAMWCHVDFILCHNVMLCQVVFCRVM